MALDPCIISESSYHSQAVNPGHFSIYSPHRSRAFSTAEAHLLHTQLSLRQLLSLESTDYEM